MNAAVRAADFFCDERQLSEINWGAVAEDNWPQCRDQKQAEFLLIDDFPWSLFYGIGVINESVGRNVEQLISKITTVQVFA